MSKLCRLLKLDIRNSKNLLSYRCFLRNNNNKIILIDSKLNETYPPSEFAEATIDAPTVVIKETVFRNATAILTQRMSRGNSVGFKKKEK